MTEREKIEKHNSMLQNYIDNKAVVKIFRTVCGEEENLYGFIIGMSKQFLLLQIDNEFTLDGYAVIRINDYDKIRHGPFERAHKKILKAEGQLSGYGFDKRLPLTSWAEILKALKGYDTHVVIQNLNKDYLDFWIGQIKRVSDKTVSIHNYDPGGLLDEKPSAIKLDTISVLKFGDRYSTIFRKYLVNRTK